MDADIEKNSADNVSGSVSQSISRRASGSISKRNQKLEAISQDFGFLGTLRMKPKNDLIIFNRKKCLEYTKYKTDKAKDRKTFTGCSTRKNQ